MTPIKGGRCVHVLKAGTATKTPKPKKNMSLRSKAEVIVEESSATDAAGGTTTWPLSKKLVTNSGTNKFTSEGKNKPLIISRAVICPPIQSMVVVTSPMGDQAPPALAAMMMMPAKNKRSSRLSSSFFINDTITMVVVRLSKMALRKNVTKPTNHIRLESFVVLMREVMTSKPLCASTTSTIAIAPIRKNTICAVLTSDSLKCSPTKCASPALTA